MSKQSNRYLAAALFFINLAPGLIFPNLGLNLAFNTGKVEADETVETQEPTPPAETPAVRLLESPTNPESNLITITAYSSTPEQTDSTPFITASGALVEDGIVACNFLKFGTKIRFPELYGDKVFVVKDRMARKNSHKIDIWFASTEQAKKFGVKETTVEVLEG